jgi:sugar/nucleoside kinase (ribokinase family)
MKAAVLGPIAKDYITIDGKESVHIGSPVYYICTALKNLGVEEVDAYANYAREDESWVKGYLKGVNVHSFFAEKTLYGKLEYKSANPDARTHVLYDFNNSIEPNKGLLAELEKFDYIIFGPLLARHIPFEFYEKLKHKNLVYGNFGAFAYLENGKKVYKNPENLIKILPYLKYVFLDNNEAMFVSGKKTIEEAGKFFTENGLENCAITEGSKGSHLFVGDKYYKIPAFLPKKIIDPTGAGDTYLAAYIRAIELFEDPEQRGRFAAMAASMSLEKEGAFDKNLEEVLRILKLEKI